MIETFAAAGLLRTGGRPTEAGRHFATGTRRALAAARTRPAPHSHAPSYPLVTAHHTRHQHPAAS
ncbi:hypothetical protein [Sphaerisporangium aureirubrum]|uniref:LysR family transcriptional regulator n=1 Tax=Sphaerisporangium aureirubrum TaxID=1544736 RepID=A0ABW1NSQ9_9ACTN